MRQIELTRGYFAQVDDEDFDRCNALRWCAMPSRHTVYAKRGELDEETGKRYTVLLHRFIMDADLGSQIDHRDRNGLNCCKYNLRIATQTYNLYNAEWPNNSTGYRGVVAVNRGGRFFARIKTEQGKVLYLGTYDTAEQAARRFDEECLKLRGEFAILNFP